MHAHELLEDAVLRGERHAELDGAREIVEHHDGVEPLVGRGERQLDLGDETVHPVGVVHEVHVVAAQLEHARRFFDGDDFEAEEVAAVAQDAPVHRADAGVAAADEAAERGELLGRGVHAQLAAVFAQHLVEHAEPDAGLRPRHVSFLKKNSIEAEHFHHRAARERHRLAEIAGAGAARHQRHAVLRAGGRDADDVLFVSRRQHHVRGAAGERRGHDRAEPAEVGAFHAQGGGILRMRDVAEGLDELSLHGEPRSRASGARRNG